jgi:hypothetical protein
MEKLIKPLSGYRAALIAVFSFLLGLTLVIGGAQQNAGGQLWQFTFSCLCFFSKRAHDYRSKL